MTTKQESEFSTPGNLAFAAIAVSLFFNILTVNILTGPSYAQAGTAVTERLRNTARLGIAFSACAEVENKLGQLFYAHIDSAQINYDAAGRDRYPIDPVYIEMVRDLGIGGVLPQLGSAGSSIAKVSVQSLQKVSRYPLLIAADFIQTAEGQAGLGFGFGLIGTFKNPDRQCLQQYSLTEAFFHRLEGINHALGPTVEKNPRSKNLNVEARKAEALFLPMLETFETFGITTTLKHFPFSNLKKASHTTGGVETLSEDEIRRKTEIFRRLNTKSDFLMTTHTLVKGFDSENIITFSDKWIRFIRQQIGFQGLILTDGLFMEKGAHPGGVKWDDTVFGRSTKDVASLRIRSYETASAISAGHDMVILDGNATDTRRIFTDVVSLACQVSPSSRKLRSQILNSFERIVAFKKSHAAQLTYAPAYPPNLINDVVSLRRKVISGLSTGKTCADLEPDVQKIRTQLRRLDDGKSITADQEAVSSSRFSAKELPDNARVTITGLDSSLPPIIAIMPHSRNSSAL